MKEKIKSMTLACLALLACLTFTACGSDDEEDINDGIGNYYILFGGVSTNLEDSNGNNLAETLRDDYLNDNANFFDNERKHTIGKCDAKTAREYFNTFVENLRQSFDTGLKGNIIENGFIEFYFVLDSDASYNGAYEIATIRVTNDGAVLQ